MRQTLSFPQRMNTVVKEISYIYKTFHVTVLRDRVKLMYETIHKLLINREYVYSVAVYQKYLTRLGELVIFEPWRENYHSFQPS